MWEYQFSAVSIPNFLHIELLLLLLLLLLLCVVTPCGLAGKNLKIETVVGI
jgi:hypothetical protein